jgi:ribosomal protein S18 acetylase RimI-like enzyme
VWALGVEPDRQRQGVGGALLEAACARCAASGGLCALETEVPENVRFYEGHGFRVIRTETIEPIGVRAWILARYLDKLSAHQHDP